MQPFLKRILPLAHALFLIACLSGCAPRGSEYSNDLKDIQSNFFGTHVSVGTHDPTPIGNLGQVTKVIDLRGFVPMSFSSKNAIRTLSSSGLRWYQVPIKSALLMLYYGTLKSDQLG